MTVDIDNKKPSKDKKFCIPNEASTNIDIDVTFQSTRLKCSHTFGYPIFILDKVV